MNSTSSRPQEWRVTAPSFAWLMVFFAVPLGIILVISFRTVEPTGAIGSGWTLKHWQAWADPHLHGILWRTFWISAITSVICLALGVPMAWFMARRSERWKNLLLLLVIVPFWTNFLIRIFAWKVLLAGDGLVARALRGVGMLGDNETLLYNPGAVILVMVYTHLPFAILPLYAAAEKFDFALLDAARDLGASARRAFWWVFLPGIRTGLGVALLMVFIPALGAYLIPDVVGGVTSEMLGNRVAQRTFSDRNLPEASAMASGLVLAVLLPALLLWRRQLFSRTAAPSP